MQQLKINVILLRSERGASGNFENATVATHAHFRRTRFEELTHLPVAYDTQPHAAGCSKRAALLPPADGLHCSKRIPARERP